MERTESTLDPIRSDLREFAQIVARAIQSQGVYQVPTSLTVCFSPDGSIRASVTTCATMFIRGDA